MKIFIKTSLLMLLVAGSILLIKCEEEKPSSVADITTAVNLDQNAKVNEYFNILQQRLPFKIVLTPYLYNLILREINNHDEDYDENNNNNSSGGDFFVESGEEQAMPNKRALSKKESPSARDLRRQQAARWDIGFGKRASAGGAQGLKAKSFMDALYGKRSNAVIKHPKVSFGRKHTWDVTYGRK